jgi:hypothetical protein
MSAFFLTIAETSQPGMSEALKITLTALAAIIVFVIGQIVVKLFIEPMQEQRKTIGEIVHALKYYKNYDSNVTTHERIQEGMFKFRSLASELDRSLVLIPCYRLLSIFKLVPRKKRVLAAGTQLVGIANSLGFGDFTKMRNNIIRELRIEHLLPDD